MPDEMSSLPARAAGQGAPALPLATLRDCFALLVAGPAPLALDGALVAGLPDRLVALDELRDMLLARSCPPATRDAAWAVVVRCSRRRGGAWTVGAAGMALPALRAVASRLGGHGYLDPADVQAEVLTGFLAALATARLDLPRIAVRLRWAAYRAGLALLTQALETPHPDPDLFHTRAVAQPWAGGPDDILAGAVADGVLTVAEAGVIAATRLADVPVSAWAACHATPRRAAYRLRDRAERRLIDYLAGPVRTGRAPRLPADEPPPPPQQRAPSGPKATAVSSFRPAGAVALVEVAACG
ncbi:hypothetical protein [Frankia sp. Cj3]|uniref:hypothetical protein n=1 Tax=Frankia sp. Cj3 TaxID=2880976 RepID=UPI001EF54AD9|nr:hypothetical protein [Frankia sp. Cj3]